MTDTTAPLAVTMADIERVEGVIPMYDNAAAIAASTQGTPGEHQATSAALRALTALARRCLEPDGETVKAVARALHLSQDPHGAAWEALLGRVRAGYCDDARAAIAALVNPGETK